MVFKQFSSDIIDLKKNFNTLNIATKEQIVDLNDLTDIFNEYKKAGKLKGNRYDSLLGDVDKLKNDNLTNYFKSIAEGAENARVNIVDAYAAILDGNTHGLKNVQSIFNTYNQAFKNNEQGQKDFTKAVGQSNTALSGYLATVGKDGTATLKGYAGHLVKTTAKTVGLQVASTALNAAISLGLSVAISGLITIISNAVHKQEELRQEAVETANSINEQSESMKDLASQYEEILDSNKTDIEKTKELNQWKNTLIETYGFEEEQLRNLNLEREKGLALLESEIEANSRKSRNTYLDDYKEQYQDAKRVLDNAGSFSYDNFFDTETFEDDIGKDIQQLFNKNSVSQISSILSSRALGFDYEDSYDALEKFKDIYNEILEISHNRHLSTEENYLKDMLQQQIDSLEKDIAEFGGVFENYDKYQAINTFQNYLKTDDGKIEDVGKETYTAWKNGLLSQASSTQMKRELEQLAEEQFPDYEKYFEHLSEARQKFVQPPSNNQYDVQWAKDKDNFLSALSPEDLEAALQIPDLFAEGLDGAAKKIDEFNKHNPIKPDVNIDDGNLTEILENTAKKVQLITTAMEEQADVGYISSSTYADIIEMGGNFADCLEVQNGKLTLNIRMLKELETQEYKNIISANKLEMARLGVQISSLDDLKIIGKQIDALEQENALYQTLIDEINNAKPDEKSDGSSGGKDETPTEIQNFLDEYAKYHHDINMGLKEEDSEYFDWLEKASAEAYANYPEYLEDLWKYEEEVYAGRKQLIQDYFDTQRELMNENISALEEKIDTLSNESVDSDGNFLNPKEKFSEIRSAYTEILTYIQTLIDEIVQSGVEGHEEELTELEKQYEEYSDKLGDVFKDEIDSEIDYIQSLQDEWDKVYDNRIDHLEKEKSAIEERYDAEIKKLQDKNDEEKRTNDLIKARQELAKAKRNRRLVFDPNGNAVYVGDTEAINEAQQNLNELETEIKIEDLEKQKEAITSVIDDEIAVLEEQKAAQESYYSALLNILETYLNPKSTQSIESVWEKVLSDPNVTVKDGSIDVKGQKVDTTAVTDGKISAGTVSKELNKESNLTQSEQDVLTKLFKSAGMSQQDITDVLTGKTKIYDLLKQPTQNNLNSVERYTNTKKEFGTVNNTDNGVNITIGDIKIDNPVGSSENLADEIIKKFPNAMIRRIYKNR